MHALVSESDNDAQSHLARVEFLLSGSVEELVVPEGFLYGAVHRASIALGDVMKCANTFEVPSVSKRSKSLSPSPSRRRLMDSTLNGMGANDDVAADGEVEAVLRDVNRSSEALAVDLQNGDVKRGSRLGIDAGSRSQIYRTSKENLLRNGSPHSRSSSPKQGSVASGSGKERKSAGSGKLQHMLNASLKLINPTYKQRSDEFRKLFKDVPDGEKFVIDYSCALQREILVQGRLYMSLNYICFYANILRWETCFAIRFKDVTSITKEKTAKVIPNAIQVVTQSGEKYFFTSFTQREKAFLIMFRIWQYSLLDETLNPSELYSWIRSGYDDVDGAFSEGEDDDAISTDPSVLSGSEMGSPVDATDTGTQRSFSGVAAAFGESEVDFIVGPGGVESVVEVSQSSPKRKKTLPRARSTGDAHRGELQSANSIDVQSLESSDSEEVVDTGCMCTAHIGKEMLNKVYPVSVDQMFLLLFTDVPFFRHLQAYRKTTELSLGEWHVDHKTATKSREVTYNIALNHAMGPKRASVCERQTVTKASKAGQLYIVKCDVQNFGIPYSDTFYVVNTFCLSRVRAHSCRLRVHGGVQYRKSCWGIVKNFIEKNALIGIQDYFHDLVVMRLTRPRSLRYKVLQQHHHKHKHHAMRETMLDNHLQAECQRLGLAPPADSVQRERPRAGSLRPAESAPGADLQAESFDRRERAEDLFTNSFLPPQVLSLAKGILIVIAILVGLNVLLFYKLWSMQPAQHSAEDVGQKLFDLQRLLDKSELNTDEWLKLFEAERRLYHTDVEKWLMIMKATVQTVDHVESALRDLKMQIGTVQTHYENFRTLLTKEASFGSSTRDGERARPQTLAEETPS